MPKAPIDPTILDQLEKEDPELVARYKQKMGIANDGMVQAQKMQDFGSFANVAGKALNDFNNSQKRDIILKNRMQNLGQPQTVIKADRPEYDGSMVDRLGQQGVDRAKASKADAESQFWNQEKLVDLGNERAHKSRIRDKSLRMEDPNSPESDQMREWIAANYPEVAKAKGFDRASASFLESKIGPLVSKYQHEADQRFQADESRKQRQFQKDLYGIKTGQGTDPLAHIPKELRDNYLKEAHGIEQFDQAIASANPIIDQLAKVGGISGNTPSWLGGGKSDYESMKSRLASELIIRVPGIRSDADFRNIVEPMLPTPGDTTATANAKAQRLKDFLQASRPAGTIADTYPNPNGKQKKQSSNFPRQVVNKETGQTATVSDQGEYDEARSEGFE